VSCERHARDWPLWAAGDLSGRRLARFQAHLAACPECAARAAALEATTRQAVEALGAAPAESPDEATWTRLLSRALDAQPVRRWAWPALAAAAAAVILTLILWLPGRGPAEAVDAGVLDAGPAPVAPVEQDVALVDAAEQADRYEMRLATSDPKVKIVWVFDRNLSI
jgi:anti-sigma factor RsiW